MDIIQAIILGLVQGLTEFLPVSSSGHLELGHAILGIEGDNNLLFAIVVHGATVLSTIVVFYKDILSLIKGMFRFKWNEETKYILKIFLSMIPVGVVGLLFKDQIEALFTGNLVFVGSMLLITAVLLAFTFFAKSRRREVSFIDSIIIGTAQVLAIIPGISRSGSTIATALLLGVDREKAARFSFLMVLIPIIGANLADVVGGDMVVESGIGTAPLIAGFLAAFISGLLACKLMINIVKKGKLMYFAAYCALVGIIAIFAA
jgi:undecaprenyl-diphosphatase